VLLCQTCFSVYQPILTRPYVSWSSCRAESIRKRWYIQPGTATSEQQLSTTDNPNDLVEVERWLTWLESWVNSWEWELRREQWSANKLPVNHLLSTNVFLLNCWRFQLQRRRFNSGMTLSVDEVEPSWLWDASTWENQIKTQTDTTGLPTRLDYFGVWRFNFFARVEPKVIKGGDDCRTSKTWLGLPAGREKVLSEPVTVSTNLYTCS